MNTHSKDIAMATLVAAASLALAACSTESATERERTTTQFYDVLGGTAGPTQWWRTAVTLDIHLDSKAPVKLWLMSGKDKGTLYDYREAPASTTLQMTAPQGLGQTLYLVSVADRQKQLHEITLTGKTEQSADISIEQSAAADTAPSTQAASAGNNSESPARAKADTRAAGSLYGSSIAGNARHNELSDDQLAEAVTLLDHAYLEHVPAKALGANCDYELKSNGAFNITLFAGNCQSYRPHILGYYYHTPGTYADIQYVDLSETEVYDYIDGLAKVQYQVNERAASQYGVLPNHWYDANFDMGDTFDNQRPNLSARLGDDAYNTIAVMQRYGQDITRLRGVSFTLNVPEGKYVGFYDRIEDQPQPEQYDRFMKMGIKPYTSREKFKAMNFSCEAMNMNVNGTYRSSVFKTAHALWLGMENDYTGGDLDCNDVMFEVSADLEIHHPTIVEPDLKPFGEYDQLMPWTMAFEDVARNADYDFNDAVIRLVPDPEKELCDVTAMAAGTTAQLFLHYDGPDGDQTLGEMHQLLGAGAGTTVNTTATVPATPFRQVAQVPWPKGYTMQRDAHRFYIEVRRGTCSDCSDVITLAEEPGQAPEALLVAGQWRWPLEGVHITTAYKGFAPWAKDNTKTEHWAWHTQPQPDTCVSY